MTATTVTHEPAPAPARPPVAPAAAPRVPAVAEQVLALQRAAGNRAVGATLAGRSLARCPSCGGTCGGAHKGMDDLLEDDLHHKH